MQVLPPIPFVPGRATLVSSSIAEPDVGETAWVSGTAYVVGMIRIVAATHRQYLCFANITGTVSPELDPTHWVDNGPSNRWAALDLLRNTAALSAPSGATSVVYVINPGERIDSIGFVGMQASSVTISMDIGATNFYSKTVSLVTRGTKSWKDYFFNKFKYISTYLTMNIPLNAGAIITITVTGNPIKIGGIILGRAQYIGGVQYNTVRSALNFSTVTRDIFGNALLVPRRSVPQTSQKLWVQSGYVDNVLALISDLNAVPALWIGVQDPSSNYYNALLILGVYQEWSLSIDQLDVATATLTLQEI